MKKISASRVFLISVFLLVFLGCLRPALAFELPNPIFWKNFEELLEAILLFLFNLALVVTPMVIVIAGYYFVTSAGDPAKVDQAKKMIFYAIIGLIIVLLSRGLVALLRAVIEGQQPPSPPPTIKV